MLRSLKKFAVMTNSQVEEMCCDNMCVGSIPRHAAI